MEARFGLGRWQTLVTGAPALAGARMTLDCIVTDVQPIATHYVIFGEVVGHRLPDHGDTPPAALTYIDRDYKAL